MTVTRRRVLAGMGVGAVAWAAPSVVTLDRAVATGSAPASCTCTAADAYALYIPVSPIGPIGPEPLLSNGGPGAGVTFEYCDSLNVAGPPLTIANGVALCSQAENCDAFGAVTDITISAEPTSGGPPFVTLTATTIAGTAKTVGADCCHPSLSSVIENLVVNGSTITVTSAPNQSFLGGILIINEQTSSCDGAGNKTFLVNALHLTVPGLIEIIAGHAEITVAASAGCTC